MNKNSLLEQKSPEHEVYNKVVQFMKDNKVTCIETIHQSDHVIQNAYELLEELYEIVKAELSERTEE